MLRVITIIFFVFAGLFILSGVVSLLGALLGLTFGIIGAVLGIVWKIVFSPLALVVLAVWIVCRFRVKPPSK